MDLRSREKSPHPEGEELKHYYVSSEDEVFPDDEENPECSTQLGGVICGIDTNQLGTAEKSRATARRNILEIPHNDMRQRNETSPLAPGDQGKASNEDGNTHEEIVYPITYTYSVQWSTRQHTGPAGIQKRSRCRSNTPKKQQRDKPHLEESYEETQMQNTGNEPEAQTNKMPKEPSSNTEHPMICIFDRGHTNISRDKFGRHLKKCTDRVKVTQSMLAPSSRRKSEKHERNQPPERE